uniref:Uncharacterized protein n=2 Tax=Kalanchoe fedtschenkoi TaxID=63787 RepID=A0A7N0VBJ7_KALFE
MMTARTLDLVDKFQDNSISILKGKFNDFPPLYQRVLSALIVEDESEEFDEGYGEIEYLEQLAMDRLTEVAYKKLLATRGSSSSKTGPTKISKQIALTFVKRTPVRCHNFEASGKSCFGDPPFRDVLAARPCVNVADLSYSVRSVFDRGKKKEVLLDDVGATTSFRAYTGFVSQLLGGAKGKRSERQPKSKPKQKSSQHPTSGFSGHTVHYNGSGPIEMLANRKRNTGPSYPDSGSVEAKKNAAKGQVDLSNLPLHDLESMEDLGDLDVWLNFDDDGLPEHDALDPLDLSGLEIPMDDLSDLNMML